MKILHLSDLHIVAPEHTLFGADPSAHLAACVADINTHHADAELCVVTGDLTHDGDDAAYARLAELLRPLRVPVRLLVGNHDRRDAFRQAFPDMPVDAGGFVQSVHRCGNIALVFLDTLTPGTHEGHLCAARLAWLDATLAELGAMRVLLFSHHPAMEIGLDSMDWLRLRDDAPLLAVLRRHGNVQHLFSGHVHRPSAGMWHGMGFSTVRGTNHQHALDLALQGPATTVMEPPGYGVVLVRDAGVVVHFHDFLDASPRHPYVKGADRPQPRVAQESTL